MVTLLYHFSSRLYKIYTWMKKAFNSPHTGWESRNRRPRQKSDGNYSSCNLDHFSWLLLQLHCPPSCPPSSFETILVVCVSRDLKNLHNESGIYRWKSLGRFCTGKTRTFPTPFFVCTFLSFVFRGFALTSKEKWKQRKWVRRKSEKFIHLLNDI